MGEHSVDGPSRTKIASRDFSAFISYSHEDAVTVRRLHSHLERYRLPEGLGGIDTGNQWRNRLGRIFRDREDLSASQDLSISIKSALDASDALIVACSPTARDSHWVNEEIRYFRNAHPDRPILAAILEGEPHEAMPDALVAGVSEPLAADLRAQGDGWQLGLLKLVAGLKNIPLDTLVQRDSQRKVRRVMAVTGGTTVLALVMLVMTTIALQARNEAQFQQAEAEGLIAFMMGELRTNLRGVGRLDVMEGVNKRALQYYSNQDDLSALPPESLERWAGILQAMGEDETKKTDGDLSAALEMFQLAHGTTRELYAREPENADRIFAHAQSEYWVGWISELRKDYAEAHRQYEYYRDLARALAKVEPETPRSAMELGWGELNMGVMSFRQDDFSNAGGEFDLAIGWFESAYDKAPNDRAARDALANAYAWRFDTHYKLGEFQEALAQRLKSVEIIERTVAENPKDLEAQFSLLIAQRAVALTHCQLGRRQPSLAALESVFGKAQNLMKSDPKNQEWMNFSRKTRADLKEVRNRRGCVADTN